MGRRRVGGIDLHVEDGGAGDPVLLLCHGLGATGAVWDGMRDRVARDWPGRWIVPDMRGHGRSDHARLYGIAMHAADMAALVENAGRVVAAGHSMGGLVGMALATGWFGAAVTDVVALGVKISWTEEERAQLARVAGTPARLFDTREQAVDRFLRVSGLAGLAAEDSRLAASGIRRDGGKYRLAADMRAGLAAEIGMTEIHPAARGRARIALACGERDAMAPAADMRALDPGSTVLPGLGHNAHVEDPEAFWRLIAGAAGL